MREVLPPVVDGRRSLLTTAAAARVAACDRATVVRAIHEGELPGLRLGPRGSYRIERADLEQWLRPVPTREDA